ncbi:MAG: thiolase family protein [Anaerolineaceae bacterium]|nr:thiolase family protein [Anaerolineaceae bacterium]
MKNVVIVAACRTPIGSLGGVFKDITALELSIPVMQNLLIRSKVEASFVEDVIWGCNYQKTYKENNLARVAAVKAGLPVSVPGITVHRNCTSSMSAIQLGYYQIRAEEADVIMAGGAESMSSAPHMVFDIRKGKKFGNSEIRDSMWDSLTNLGIGPAMGITAENLAKKYSISREEQDQLAFTSQQRAAAALKTGRFQAEIIPVQLKGKKGDIVVDTDEYPKIGTTLDSLAKLKPAFMEQGTVTAGNASGMNDGAAGVLLMSEDKAKELGIPILAKILAVATTGVDPDIMGIGPVSASQKALAKTGLTLQDIELFEINEAFAAQYLAVEKVLGLKREITNVNGSGIALGHPVGCSGSRLVTSLIYEMKKRSNRYGLASLCAGGGMGTTVVLEVYP